jgi:hypothetical protein
LRRREYFARDAKLIRWGLQRRESERDALECESVRSLVHSRHALGFQKSCSQSKAPTCWEALLNPKLAVEHSKGIRSRGPCKRPAANTNQTHELGENLDPALQKFVT